MVKKQAGTSSARAAPRQQPGTNKAFTMRHLWRMTLWAAAAACALLIAVLAGRNEAGAERIASVFSSGHREARVAAAEHPFDAKAETRRLADAIHDLGAENAQLRTKLAEIEQNMNDITGSVTKQIAAVKAAGPWPADAKPEPVTAADIASIMAPAAGLETPAPSAPQTSPVSAQPAEPQASPDLPPIAPPPVKPHEFGVDMGNALSIQVLHARWLGIRSAHAQLFAGLTPTVTLREIPKTKRIELHLVVGPMVSSAAAARLCLELAPYGLYCHPTVLEPGGVALQ
ncbi:MAG TPA: hypothetical protein VIJ04_03245 [Xanthobacteraceae bacterium]